MATETLTATTLGGLKLHKVATRASYMNCMIYGDSGTGKTHLAGSADAVPELRPVLMIDFEGGTESLVRHYPEVQQVRVETWTEMQAVYDELHRGQHGFQTVILDSLTEIQKFNMYNIMEELATKRPDLDQDVPGMREWGKNLEQMRKFVRGFRDLKMNTIFTALKKEDRNEKTGMVTTLPSLSGKLAGEVAAFLDIVAYYYVKRVGSGEEAVDKRLLLTKKTETVVAKDRTGTLPLILEDPDMKMMWDLFTAKAS
jgi:hypothetical protein